MDSDNENDTFVNAKNIKLNRLYSDIDDDDDDDYVNKNIEYSKGISNRINEQRQRHQRQRCSYTKKFRRKCSTQHQIKNGINNNNNNDAKKYLIKKNRSVVIVLDLDKTLIDDSYKLFPKSDEFIINLSKIYKLILWTAGNKLHVQQFLQEFNLGQYFDHCIFNLHHNTKSVAIVRKYCLTSGPYVLVDDKIENLITGGYDIPINVSLYYKYLPNKKYYVNYERLRQDIENMINIWCRDYSPCNEY